MSDGTEHDPSIQNDFFNQARKAHGRVTIFLTGGRRLVGRIKAFDRYTVILDLGGGVEEMVFKHAIATISSSARPPHADHRGGEGRFTHPAAPAGESESAVGTAPKT